MSKVRSELNRRIFARLAPKRRLPCKIIYPLPELLPPARRHCSNLATRVATSCLLLCPYHTGRFGCSSRQPTVVDLLARALQPSGYLRVWVSGYLRLLPPKLWSNITAASSWISRWTNHSRDQHPCCLRNKENRTNSLRRATESLLQDSLLILSRPRGTRSHSIDECGCTI